jgi:uncharacterized protein involved in response to NO
MNRHLVLHGEPPRPRTRPPFAVTTKGFRPFFLLAAAHACVIVPVWILVVEGLLAPRRYLDPVAWHAHEMVFGFAVAVIAGFLLTAVGNWTQRETATGAPLLGLAAAWLLGRVAMSAAAALPRGWAAATDLAFLPLLAAVLARPLVAARNRRNFVMLAVLAALFVANVFVHLEALGLAPAGSARRACLAAVDVIAFLMLVIAGRVLPMFTRNATGMTTVRSSPALDALTAVGMVGVTALDIAWPETRTAATAAGAVGVLAIARAARWFTRAALRHPLLWILQLGYAWIPVSLLLRAAPSFGAPVWGSLATHAMTAGAIGSLTLGMMARVALGHSGRPLVASRAMSWAFVAITGAAMARVMVPLFAPTLVRPALVAAALLWTAAFGTYLVVYVPVLLSPRIDEA